MEKQQWRSLEDKEVIIIGAGGHAKVISDILKKNNRKIYGILDDNVKGNNILGKLELIEQYKDSYEFIIAIGNNDIREKISQKYNVKYTIAIHPQAIIAEEVEIKEGTVIMAGAIINTDSKIGKHCIVNTGAIIEHDNFLEDYVHISPNATLAGTVKVRKKSWIGAGAVIIQNKNIGHNCIVGAGAVVIKDVVDKCIVVGNPAKVLRNL